MCELSNSEQVIFLFQSGLTQTQIAVKIGRSQHYVSKRLIKAGIARSKKETYAIKSKDHVFVTDPKIIEMYAAGMSSIDISLKIKRSHGYVLRHVRVAGIVRTSGQTLRIKASRNPKVVRVTPGGYAVISVEGCDKLLHRIIVESCIGRGLGRKEHIHHKDGNKLNNNIENLEIISQTLHNRKHLFLGINCCICGTPMMARGLCKLHYQQAIRGGWLKYFPRFTNLGVKSLPY